MLNLATLLTTSARRDPDKTALTLGPADDDLRAASDDRPPNRVATMLGKRAASSPATRSPSNWPNVPRVRDRLLLAR